MNSGSGSGSRSAHCLLVTQPIDWAEMGLKLKETHLPGASSLTPLVFLDKHPEFKNDTFVENNLALLHIYFKDMHFMRHERGELYGIVDFFSNIGGLLGLCMGFREGCRIQQNQIIFLE
jgi:hypothetical protein